MIKILDRDQIDQILNAVLEILRDVGMRIESTVILERLAALGAKVDFRSQIVKFPYNLVEETLQWQRKNTSSDVTTDVIKQWRHIKFGDKKHFSAHVDGARTFFYDWEKGIRRRATREDLIKMIHLCDSLQEIGTVGLLLVNSESDPRIEVIESLVLLLHHTSKPGRVGILLPEQAKYIAEIGGLCEGSSPDNRFMGNDPNTTSPLILGKRAAECMLELMKYLPVIVITCPIAGINTPVTAAGNIVIACAEIIGVWIAARSVKPDQAVYGGVCSGVFDRKEMKTCLSTPETILQDSGTFQVFKRICGEGLVVPVGVGYIDAKLPGIQATWEKMFKASALSQMTGIEFHIEEPELLDTGQVFSPTQLMLCLEMDKGIWRFSRGINVSDETIALDVIKHVGVGKSFIGQKHTIKNFRKHLWSPSLFDRTFWKEEKEEKILRMADERWRISLKDYTPPVIDPDLSKSLKNIVKRARKELCT